MKSYTFADADKPVAAHMRGLVSGIQVWKKEAERNRDRAASMKSRQYWRGKVQAFQEIIEIIEDSHSVDD